MEVRSRTLDELAKSGVITAMNLLKIDLEQGEDLMLEGARSAFGSLRPRLVMCETSTASRIHQFWRDLGYRPYRLDEAGAEARLPDGDYWGNVFFTR